MKLNIKFIHNDNGSQTVTTIPADLLKWERMTRSKMTDLIKSRRVDGEDVIEFSLGYEDLMVMAYSVMTRTGQTTAKFEAWVDGLESIELDGIDETVPPSMDLSEQPLEL